MALDLLSMLTDRDIALLNSKRWSRLWKCRAKEWRKLYKELESVMDGLLETVQDDQVLIETLQKENNALVSAVERMTSKVEEVREDTKKEIMTNLMMNIAIMTIHPPEEAEGEDEKA